VNTVNSSEFLENFDIFLKAIEDAPIAVVCGSDVLGIFISPQHFSELDRLRGSGRTVCAVEDLPEDAIRAIAHSQMDPRHDGLNALLSDSEVRDRTDGVGAP
jgi:hypothetical protein